jgi:Asp/Glu/hydantoin racemase
LRLWWQSFVDRAQNAPYLDALAAYLRGIAEPGTEIDVHGMSPGDRDFGRLAEHRCATQAIAAALEAEAAGYDGFVLGHFQDPGLYTIRASVRLPVVGLGETSLHWAAQLGRRIALVTIDPVFEVWHLEQAELYGLAGRVSDVGGMGAVVEDFARAFAEGEGAGEPLLQRFRELCEPLVAGGADVIVPAGALPGLLLRDQHGLTVGHAPVVNCVAVTLKAAETWVRLRELTGLEPSRGPSFAIAAPGAVSDFRNLVEGDPDRDG